MSMDKFFTRQTANDGVKVPLFYPDGTRSDEWLMVRGVDSDAFRVASVDSQREVASIAAIADKQERDEAVAASQRKVMSSLVIGWSFEAECTPEAVQAFFREAPQIMGAVDKIVSDRAFFFALASSSSSDTQSSNSG